MDLAHASGQPIEIALAGATYRVRVRPLGELGGLQAIYKREIPSPLLRAAEALDQAEARGVKLSEPTRRLLISQAHREAKHWPPLIGSLAWLSDVDEAGLAADVLHFALKPEHPELGKADCEAIWREATDAELAAFVAAFFRGKAPGDADPKAATGTGETTAPPPSG